MNEDHRDLDWSSQVELLRKAIKSLDTGHWAEVEVSMTGQNADLEVTGHQGFGFEFSLHAAYVHVCPMAMKRHTITDVVLNLPSNTPREEYEESLKWYLDEAAEMVSAHWKPTERDGSGWISTHQGRIYEIEVLRVNSTDEIDIEGTVAAVIAAFRDGNSSWVEEMTRLDQWLKEWSGWLRFNSTTGQYEQLPPAKPRPSLATPEQNWSTVCSLSDGNCEATH